MMLRAAPHRPPIARRDMLIVFWWGPKLKITRVFLRSTPETWYHFWPPPKRVSIDGLYYGIEYESQRFTAMEITT